MSVQNWGPGRFEFVPERDGVTILLSGAHRPPGDHSQVSLTRREAAAVVELICKNANLPAPWAGQSL